MESQIRTPERTKLADYFEKDEKDFPEELMKAKCVRKMIRVVTKPAFPRT